MSWLPILPEASAKLFYIYAFFLQFQVVTTLVLVIKINIVHVHHIICVGLFLELDQSTEYRVQISALSPRHNRPGNLSAA